MTTPVISLTATRANREQAEKQQDIDKIVKYLEELIEAVKAGEVDKMVVLFRTFVGDPANRARQYERLYHGMKDDLEIIGMMCRGLMIHDNLVYDDEET